MKTYEIKEAVATYRAWYDRYIRLWTAYRIDPATGHQSASAGYGTTKADAVDAARHEHDYA